VDEFGQTALHYCTENTSSRSAGHVFKSVLETKDVLGRTALHLSVISGNVTMVKFLLGKKANVNVQDCDGHSTVHFATGNIYIYICNCSLYCYEMSPSPPLV